MDLNKIQKYLNKTITVLVLLLVIIIAANILELEKYKKSPEEIEQYFEQKKIDYQKIAAGKPLNDNIPTVWPPKMNDPYPDFELINTKGQKFSLEEFAGKAVIMEYIDMSSPVSQAQSGANIVGPFGVTRKDDIDRATQPLSAIINRVTAGRIAYPNDDIMHIQVLVRTQTDGQPTLDDADRWKKHFDINEERDNIIVSVPVKDLRDRETTGKILTGYQLIDRKQRLRADSSGTAPKHNLELTLIKLLESLVQN